MASKRIKLTPELKRAISELPEREKDKLLFRLLPGKPDIVRRLEFDLLEDGNTRELRREELLESLRTYLNEAVKNYYSPGYLLLDLRHASGRITEHVKTTKDKEGEVSLNFTLLLESLPRVKDKLKRAKPGKSRTLTNWTIQRTKKLIGLVQKMHPDLQYEYRGDLRELGDLIDDVSAFQRRAEEEGLDIAALRRG